MTQVGSEGACHSSGWIEGSGGSLIEEEDSSRRSRISQVFRMTLRTHCMVDRKEGCLG